MFQTDAAFGADATSQTDAASGGADGTCADCDGGVFDHSFLPSLGSRWYVC